MMTANFYRVWIDNTKSPFFRSSKLKTLDTAIRDYCATLDGPINAPGRQTAADTMLTAWDEWQRSKELEGGWWNSDRNNLSNGKLRFFANEMVPLMQARTPRAVVGAPVCFDSPHLTRAGNDGAEIAFSLAPKAIEVWAKSQRSGKRGDTFIGITQRSTGVCHMLPTYERCANNGGPLIDGGRMTNPATDKVKNRIFVNAPVRTVQDIHDTFGVPPRFGNVGRNFIIAESSRDIDGYYHNTLFAIANVPAADGLGWALQGCPAHGAGWFRFVSSKNSGVFDLGNGPNHEGRDLPPAWAKAISDCVAHGLGLTVADKFTESESGKGDATRIRNFTC
ncbi:MAG: hypothetical protein ABSG32_29100 [Terriglobia bacterium]|jgi:hypothetical protein